MTPLGHLSMSLISIRYIKKLSLFYVLLGAVTPDIDFLFIFTASLNEMHRGPSHSFLVTIIVAIFIYLFSRGEKKINFFSFVFASFLHIFIDSILDGNYSNGIGTQMFWPFSKEYYSPFNLLDNSSIYTWNEPWELIKSSLFISVIIEAPFYYLAYRLYLGKKNG